MGLFPLHCTAIALCHGHWIFLKLKLDSQSRFTIPEFSGYHCIMTITLLEF